MTPLLHPCKSRSGTSCFGTLNGWAMRTLSAGQRRRWLLRRSWGSTVWNGTRFCPYATEASTPPPDWRTQALVLAHHPVITGPERAFLLKLASWRAPGVEGLTRLREIAGRTGVEI